MPLFLWIGYDYKVSWYYESKWSRKRGESWGLEKHENVLLFIDHTPYLFLYLRKWTVANMPADPHFITNCDFENIFRKVFMSKIMEFELTEKGTKSICYHYIMILKFGVVIRSNYHGNKPWIALFSMNRRSVMT